MTIATFATYSAVLITCMVQLHRLVLLRRARADIMRSRYENVIEIQRTVIARLDAPPTPVVGHACAARPVAVVPFAHSDPVAWICPTCSIEVAEPEPLGPIFEGRFKFAAPVDNAPAPTPIQRRTGYTPGQAPPLRSIRDAHAGWDRAVLRSLEVDNESLAKDGWRREADGSMTQLAKPEPTRISTPIATPVADGEEKIVVDLFLEPEAAPGHVRRPIVIRDPDTEERIGVVSYCDDRETAADCERAPRRLKFRARP